MMLLELEDSSSSPIWMPASGQLHMNERQIPASELGSGQTYFPFRVKHLGRPEVYTLCAMSQGDREQWCNRIMDAKMTHMVSVRNAGNENFSLRIVDAEALDLTQPPQRTRSWCLPGSPLARALEATHPGNVRSAANTQTVKCATIFYLEGVKMVAEGTDDGLTIFEAGRPRVFGSPRADLKYPRIRQITVLATFNIFLFLSNDTLFAYHLDALCGYVREQSRQERLGPTKLGMEAPIVSQILKKITFFVVASVQGRVLAFCAERRAAETYFKVEQYSHQRH